MGVYTPKPLAVMAALTTSAATIYTVPGATTAIVRTIQAQANTGTPTFTLALDTDAAGVRIFDAYVLAANVPSIFNGWWVAATGKTFQAKASATTVDLGIYGYEYA